MMQDDQQRLEEENRCLREENALLHALVAELLPLKEQVARLQAEVKQLESRLAKDSHNSHLPPSSDRFRQQPKSLRKKSGKKPGAQKGHEGTTLFLSQTPDEVVVHEVGTCWHCRADLREEPILQVERRQVLDVPPKRLITWEHQAHSKYCPHCRTIMRASFPQGVQAPVQYGPALGAVAIYLVQQQLLPYERACETIQDVLGPSMTVGTLKALVERCAEHLLPIEEQIKIALRQGKLMHQDETSLTVCGKRIWMHVACTACLTHYAVHQNRGRKALDAIGLLNGFAGVSLHDGWASYQGYDCVHALCNVHHLRDLTFVEEVMGQPWAASMKTLLLDMKEAVHQARALDLACLPEDELHRLRARYRTILLEANLELPEETDTGPPKKGRKKQSPARNLLDRLMKYEEQVLRFLHDFDVPFDNSQAERDIRMVKVQQKVSGCFRSLPGAQAFCRIRGYLATLRKQGLPLITALEQALVGHPLSPAF
ncbi:MAG TPA: IS66 family transposase [Ktedonosporobacter sp.]|jgi:transposase|nr:IS66 family transposase [Ktedonosporobacter sp.]